MTGTLKFKVDGATIRMKMKDQNIHFQNIEELTFGTITVHQLKNIMNHGIKATEDTIKVLAEVLNCTENDLIDKNCLISENIPFETISLTAGLYAKTKEDMQPLYAKKITEFKASVDLKNIIDQAHRLFMVFTDCDDIYDKQNAINAINLIITEFEDGDCLCNSEFTELRRKDVDAIFELLKRYSGEYTPQHALLLFLYVFILFDAIFLEESICSAVQLMPERTNNKANQYYILTYGCEKMRDALIDKLIYKNYRFDDESIEDLGLDDVVIDGIILMLTACEKCFQHLEGPWTYSEYVNRTTLSAILKTLGNKYSIIGIETPPDSILNMATSRFGRQYFKLKTLHRFFNTPNDKISNNNGENEFSKNDTGKTGDDNGEDKDTINNKEDSGDYERGVTDTINKMMVMQSLFMN
ncbi:MAG: hypothetical protein LBU84_18135 [Prevotella sp.]|jgi:hypothetical protein|nr:hypothetical protein [Prevotella sp.]